MSKIRILPDHLANQIAAGEVVERPASVVKELVENSLDAGANRIEVEIEGGGSRLMRIIDNGCGMEEDDLLMSLERHGTSKIREQEDLGAINTLGFRGEAIPSIGSVSKLSMISRSAESELGTKVVLEYGKLLKVHEAGCAIGTTIEVRRLFGNTPARRKFLRTTRTEQSHIEEVMKNYGLGCPEISFILRVDGRETLHLDEKMSLDERLARIMRYTGEFIEIKDQMNKGCELERRVQGYLVPPETVTSGPSRLRLFVNGRAVRDRMMTHAVTEGLRGFLMKGKNPSGLVTLTLNPSEIDVNVHPAKHEIRFRNSNDVHAFLVQSVVQAMEKQQKKLQARIFQPRQAERPVAPANEFPPPPPLPEQPFLQATAERWTEVRPATGRSTQTRPGKPTPPPPQSLLQGAGSLPPETSGEQEITSPVNEKTKERQQFHNLRIIGVFEDLYIFCQGSEGLVVIDQHAAHERLLYEKLRTQYLSSKIASQALMFPETIELSLFQTQLLEKNFDKLERMGFALRDFGGNTFVISGVPAITKSTSGRELLLDVLEQFGNEEGNRSSKGGEMLDTILATMACRAAVKANTVLSKPEIEGLLNDMAQAELFSHCPHGRPVVKHFTDDEVKKWFYRG